MENLIKQIEELRERVMKTGEFLDIDGKESKIRELQIKVNQPDFWQNQELAVTINKEIEDLQTEVDDWRNLYNEVKELEELVAVSIEDSDDSFSLDARKKYKEFLKKFEK